MDEQKQTQTEKKEQSLLSKSSFYSSGGNKPRLKTALKVASKKKGLTAGVASLVVASVIALMSIFSIPGFQLIHIVENLSPHNFISNNIVSERSTRLLQRRFRGLTDSGGNARRTGSPVIDRMIDGHIDNWMNKHGVEVEYEQVRDNRVRATEVVLPDGQRITDFDNPRQFRKAMKPYVKEVAPIGMRRFYLNEMGRLTGHNWRFFLGQRVRDAGTRAKNRLLGIDDSDGVRSSVDEGNRDTDGDGTDDISQEEIDTAENTIDSANEAAEDLKSQVAAGEDVDVAAKRTARRFSSKSTVLYAGMVGCLLYGVQNANDEQVENEYLETLGYGNRTLSAVSELKDKEGNASAAEVTNTAELYDSEVVKEKDGELITAHEDFSQSAAWKRAVGAEVLGAEQDNGLLVATEDVLSAKHQIANTLGSLFGSIPGIDPICGFIGNQVVQWTLTAGEFIGSLGIGKFIVTAATEVAEELFLANVVKFFTYSGNVVVDGPQMALGVLDMSLNASNMENSRRIGLTPTSNDEYESIRAAYNQERNQGFQSQPFMTRYFALDHPKSYISKFAISMNSTLSDGFGSILKLPTKSFSSILNSLFGSTVYGQGEPFNNYGIAQFAQDEETLANYDPYDHAWVIELQEYTCSPKPVGINEDGAAEVEYFDKNNNSCNMSRWEQRMQSVIIQRACMGQDQKADNYIKLKRGGYLEGGSGELGDFKWRIKKEWSGTYEGVPWSASKNWDYKCDENSAIYEKTGMWKLDEYIAGNFECLAHTDPCGTTSGTRSSVVDDSLAEGSTEQLAGQILEHPNIEFDGGSAGRVRNSFVQASKDGKASLYWAESGEYVEVSSQLLKVALKLSEKADTLRISSLTTGFSHSTNSTHYKGTGIDIGNESVANSIMPYLYNNRDALNIHELIFSPMPEGTTTLKNGEPYTYPSSTMSAHRNHIHISVKE